MLVLAVGTGPQDLWVQASEATQVCLPSQIWNRKASVGHGLYDRITKFPKPWVNDGCPELFVQICAHCIPLKHNFITKTTSVEIFVIVVIHDRNPPFLSDFWEGLMSCFEYKAEKSVKIGVSYHLEISLWYNSPFQFTGRVREVLYSWLLPPIAKYTQFSMSPSWWRL